MEGRPSMSQQPAGGVSEAAGAGCPPKPEAMISGLSKLMQTI